MKGRLLRPPPVDTALDRIWQQRQWRLERAHDDWGLHAVSGDPRAPIHRAAGLVRLCRQAARDRIRAYRRTIDDSGRGSEAAEFARYSAARAIRAYRLAIAGLAGAVADFDRHNTGIAVKAETNSRTNASWPTAESVS